MDLAQLRELARRDRDFVFDPVRRGAAANVAGLATAA
jgi:hypothetical protein